MTETAGDWPDLARAVRTHALPTPLLRDLLSAFEQDVVTSRYASFESLLDYCRRSANPIGRLLLVLYGRSDGQCEAWSDAICTALQLTNFWQDVGLDWHKGRIYLPAEDLQRFAVGEPDLASGLADDRWSALMQFETQRTRALMLSGAPLARALPGRIGFELRLVIHGGAAHSRAHRRLWRRRVSADDRPCAAATGWRSSGGDCRDCPGRQNRSRPQDWAHEAHRTSAARRPPIARPR